MQEKSCAFVGHRNLKDYDMGKIKADINLKIESLLREGVTTFFSNCEIGFEMLAAIAVIEMKKVHPQIKLNLILSNYDKDIKRSKKNCQIYNYVKSKADLIYWAVSRDNESLSGKCKDMIDNVEYIIAAGDGDKQSKSYTPIRYAESQNKRIIFLNIDKLYKDCKNSDWAADEEFITEYGVDFSETTLSEMLDEYNLRINPEDAFCEKYDALIDPYKKENFEAARVTAFNIAKWISTKVNIVQCRGIPFQIIELEGDKIKFDSVELKNMLTGLISKSDFVNIKSKENGKAVIVLGFDLKK